MDFPQMQPGGKLTATFDERDGTTSELDMTRYADLLLELGWAQPRSVDERTEATELLGQIECSDDTVFVLGEEILDTHEFLDVIGDGLYRLLSDAIWYKMTGRSSADDVSPVALEAGVVDEEGRSWLSVPEAFWEMGCVADNERFDLLELGDGALLLRACPYSQDEFRAIVGTSYHSDDPAFTQGSHCGLTKWTCAGCGGSTILENEEEFPEGWFEVSRNKPDGDTLAYEAVCTMGCLGKLAVKGADALRATRIPGFGPRVDEVAVEG
jgi:hypothetical protein